MANWRKNYDIAYTEDEKLLIEQKLNEKLEKEFLKNLHNDNDLSSTAPSDKVLQDDNFFMSVNDTFMSNSGITQRKASENIPLWRRMSINNIYVRYAIEQIINECIVNDGRTDPIKLDFSPSCTLKDITKKRITDEWKYLAGKVLKIKENMHNHFKMWYVDGVIIFEDIYDNKRIRDGIKKIKVIDPLGLVYGSREFKNLKDKKINSKKVWYYDKANSLGNFTATNSGFANLFNPFDYNNSNKEIYFAEEQISFSTSDIFDSITGNYLSYLNFATRPLNQLFAVENAFVVFALTRSTDKLVYYIDVGSLPEPKVKARIQEIARDNSTQAKYDASRGSIIDTPDKIKLTNEIYLARRNGTKGTEISSLSQSTVNLGDVSILTYLKDNLDTSLFMPRSRSKDSKVNIGYAKEIDYEELAFYKFILKLRNEFISAYVDILGKHLIAKHIITQREWENEIKSDILFIFNDNNDYERMKYIYDLQEKVAMIDTISAYVKLPAEANDKIDIFDIETDILKNILQYTDDQIIEWRKRMNIIKSTDPEVDQQNNQDQLEEPQYPEDYNGYQVENLLEIFEKNKNKNKQMLAGEVSFNDIDSFSEFFELLKENDEVVIRRNGKITNLKWGIENGELVEK